ncbi:hypothetical protein GCM10023223_46210 [Stackebrandtia albiflava]
MTAATVSQWRKRHTDFPPSTIVRGRARFNKQAIIDWLRDRRIPTDARRPGESDTATYADRMSGRASNVPPVVEPMVEALTGALWRFVDGGGGMSTGETLISLLLYLQGCHPGTMEPVVTHGMTALSHGKWSLADQRDVPVAVEPILDGAGGKEFLRGVADVVRTIESPQQAAIVFDAVLTAVSKQQGRKRDLQTPESIARLLARLVSRNDDDGPVRVIDPFCRTGELLTALMDERGGSAADLQVWGYTPTRHHRGLAEMRIRLHGGSCEPTSSVHPEFLGDSIDVVVSNPPFNMRAAGFWDAQTGHLNWPYGVPPKSNANFGWLQIAVSLLNEDGRACIVMAPNAASTQNPSERAIRRAMIDAGAVEAIIELPPQLFSATGIAVTVWVLRKPVGAPTDVLFIDMSDAGERVTPTLRVLSDSDMQLIVSTVEAGRGAARPQELPLGPRRAVMAAPEQITAADHVLVPRRYLPLAPDEPDQIIQTMEVASQLADRQQQAQVMDERVRRNLERLLPWNP